MTANLRTIGSAIGTALLTAIVVGSPLHRRGPRSTAGARAEGGSVTGFLVLAALAGVSALVVLGARFHRPRAARPIAIVESPLEAEAQAVPEAA